jgi:phage-related baseplate assembly protein
MAAPILVENDPYAEIQACIDFYKADTGVEPQPGSPEMKIINMIASRMTDHRSALQSAGTNMLVRYSKAPVLDELGYLVGVIRLVAQNANATIEFTFPPTHGNILLPADMRIQTTDGKVVFALAEDLFVAEDVETISALCIADTPGIIGNDYAIGDISIILDPQPFLLSAANTDISNSGSDQETDEQLRERIILAPNSFSVAGPVDAYKYFTYATSPLIIDVAVPNPPAVAGTVVVYPLVAGGIDTPTELLDAVQARLDPEKTRTMCDTVVVQTPTKTSYGLTVKITKKTGAVNQDILDIVTPSLTQYLKDIGVKLGRDVLITNIKKKVCYDEAFVYDCALFLSDGTTPFTDIVVSETQYAFCDTLDILIVGSNAG